ncbi:MAG: primase C-terminal domain-containing protein [Rubrobacter sp.]|nr:primase C-terminal domain-containing protein [Rubrobacter sp.]MBA3616822.1 primase C-terminal domain-containing protein [Rubrobacteraceae bacterium]
MDALYPTSTVSPTEEVQKFWRHLFGGGDGFLQVWTGVRSADGSIPSKTIDSRFFDYPAQAARAAQWALERSEKGREIFFCSHLLLDRRRIKENAASVRSLWGDLDGADIPNGELKPTTVVESSPGRFHAYWRLTNAIPPELAERLNQRLAQRIGADPSGFDRTQLLRVPATTNYKYEGKPAVRLIRLEGWRSYSAAELNRILPQEGQTFSRGAEPVGECIPPGKRNDTLASLAGTMRRRGMGEAEIFAALKVTNRLRCRPSLPVEEVRRIVQSVSRYEPASAPWWVKVVSKNA